MRAAVITEPGGPDVLKIMEVDDPVPGPEDILVDVKASALNRADMNQRQGNYPAPFVSPSDIPGLEFAGVVLQVGERVQDIKEGDRVFGLLGGGGYANRTVTHHRMAVKMPVAWDFIQAAATPEVYYTAYDALFNRANLQMGDSVLVHAAGGGVGSAAVQLAHHAGAFVFGTAGSDEKLSRASDLGMNVGINYHDQDFSGVIKELTSGSSWHAAGNVHVISSDPNISRMMAYTIGLYKEIEKESGHSCGFKPSGGFYLASNDVWAEYLKRERSKARYMGLDQEFISLEEVKKKNPLIDPSRYLLALWDPIDGEVDPSGVTYAFAKAAKVHGGKYYTHTVVKDTKQKKDGSWNVVTDKGNITAEIVINAGGLWAREVGNLAGLNLPVQPMEHHYLITEAIPEIEAMGDQRLPIGTDFEGNIYFRQEGKGMLLGTYEAKSTPWKIEGTPMNFGHELLEPKLDNIQDRLAIGFKRMPAL